MKPHELSARELAKRLAQRELTALEVVEDCLERIADDPIYAWAALDPAFARSQARALDTGAVRGLLHGVPVGVKDIFDTADLPTEYGSTIYKGHRPVADAACVAMARANGAIVLGKTVTTEFATMVPASTVHPKDPRRTPGGSSSGSAAAVAAGMVPLAYGTQTVGSTIRPAAYCGLVGFKPSYGYLSRSGMKMGAESLDTPGVIARGVEDAALLVAASAMRPELPFVASLDRPKLGVCCSPNWRAMSREGAQHFERTVQELEKKGASVLDAEMPDSFDKLDAAAATILNYEMARGLAYEATQYRSKIAPILVERVDIGTRIAYREYALALEYAADCRRMLAELTNEVDAIVTPAATGEAPLGLQSTGDTAMNRLWTLLHGPCISVPAGDGPSGMPLGIQLVGVPTGQHSDRVDAHLLAVARWVETVLK